jgi:hypothetical protein
MSVRFRDAGDPAVAAEVIATCALATENVGGLDVYEGRLKPSKPGAALDLRYETALGASLYRAGKFDEAVQRLSKGVKDDRRVDSVLASIFLAMSYHRLGRADKSQASLSDAASRLGNDRRVVKLQNRWVYVPWHDRLHLEIVFDEARTLIAGGPQAGSDPRAEGHK